MNQQLLRQSTIVVDDIRSPLIQSGPANAEEAIVFVHGNPGSSHDWEDLVRRCGGFSRAIAMDMPGFGRADKPHDFPYTVEGYAAHLGRMLEQLGVRRAHLVLHDVGGPWALEWAAGHPDTLASVVQINSFFLGYRWHFLARIWRTPLLGELFMVSATKASFRILSRRGNPAGFPKAYVDRAYDDFDRGTRRAVLKLYRGMVLAAIASRQRTAVRPLDRPALIVWGKHDPYLPVALAERQRDAFPRARVVVLEDSGHWPMIEDPDGVAAAVIPFLREQVTTSAG